MLIHYAGRRHAPLLRYAAYADVERAFDAAAR